MDQADELTAPDLAESPPPESDWTGECRPELSTFEDKTRMRRAAELARQLYPGPVGELVCIELRDWAAFGYRFGSSSHIVRLVAHLIEKGDEVKEPA